MASSHLDVPSEWYSVPSGSEYDSEEWDFEYREAAVAEWATDPGIFAAPPKPQLPHVTPPSIKICSHRTPLQDSYLDKLPFDCLRDITLLLDMQSVFRFRQTNLNVRQNISALFEYRCVTAHALGLFQASLKHQTARYITLAGFHQQLCNTRCKLCRRPRYVAFFVDLLSWDKYCVRHVEDILNNQMVRKSFMRNQTRMPNELLDEKPSFMVGDIELVPCDWADSEEMSTLAYRHIYMNASHLFTRIAFQTPYLGTTNNGLRAFSSALLVLKFLCQTRAWIRRIGRNPYQCSLFQYWGLDYNPELIGLFQDLGINPHARG